MATPVSLAQLMLRARRRSNLEGASAFIPDSEVTDEINTAISAWWDLIKITTFAGQIARAPWPITTVNNQSLYPLAPNNGQIISVDLFLAGATQPIPIKKYQEEQRGMFTLLPFVGWSPGFQQIWYQQQGTNINFIPIPTGGYSVQVNYIPTAPVLSQPNKDFLNSVNGWEEYVVLGAAIRMALKDGQLDLVAKLQELQMKEEIRIGHAAANLDGGQEGVHEDEAYGFGQWNFGF